MKYYLTSIILLYLIGCGGNQSGSTTDDLDDNSTDNTTESTSNNPGLDPNALPVLDGNWYRPQLFVTWQIQLNKTLNTNYPVEIFDIDLIDTPKAAINKIHAQGKKVICYFSAGTYEDWRPDASAFSPKDLGKPLADWPGERWLDIRSSSVHKIMKKRLDLAKQKGCDGVDPDNMDGYTQNSGYNLSAKDQIAYNKFIANEAHIRNLSVGLKNSLEQVAKLVDYFDFAVNEQCHEYNECHLLSPFIESGKPVLHIEYVGESIISTANSRQTLCNDSINNQFSTLILPLGLDDKFRHAC